MYAGINFLRPANIFFARGQQVLTEIKIKIETTRTNRKQKNLEDRMKNSTKIVLKFSYFSDYKVRTKKKLDTFIKLYHSVLVIAFIPMIDWDQKIAKINLSPS